MASAERMERFNTQPPEGGCVIGTAANAALPTVSTHSRPKAAAPGGVCLQIGLYVFQHTAARRRLLAARALHSMETATFQHTAARRRLPTASALEASSLMFQHTAARRRLHPGGDPVKMEADVSTHSRPKAAAGRGVGTAPGRLVSTHSRPKAAACSRRRAV